MRLTVGKKIGAGFASVLALVLIIGSLGIFTEAKIYQGTKMIGNNQMPKSILAEQMNTTIAKFRQYEIQYVFSHNLDDMQAMKTYLNLQNDELKHIKSLESHIKVLIADDQDQKLFDQFTTEWKNYLKINERVVAAIKAKDNHQATQILRGDAKKSFDLASSELDAFLTYNQKQSQQVVKQSASNYQVTRNFSVIIILVTIVLGLGIALYISRSISQSVTQIAQVATNIAEGDLTAKTIQVHSNDEIGDMSLAFNRMLTSLQNLIRQVDQSARHVSMTSQELNINAEGNSVTLEQVARAVKELATGNAEQARLVSDAVNVVDHLMQSINNIAEGAHEQASNVSVTNDMTVSVAKRIQEAAARTKDIEKAAELSYRAAESGGAAVQKSILGFKQIQSAVMGSAEKISELGQASQHIGEIIQVIDEIAEQTNLLALNAAIEAARAGEQGKGFAVVADEVRHLAERSSAATKEIAQIVAGIQQGTEAAVVAMGIGTQEVEKGVQISQEAGSALEEIISAIKQTRSEMEEIIAAINDISASITEVSKASDNLAALTEENTAATEEMASGSRQMNGAMENIAAITEESAASAEEVAASTDEISKSTGALTTSAQTLSKMAQELQIAVSQFKL